MYSEAIAKLLKKANAAPGDTIELKKGSESFRGILMPKTGTGDPNCIVIKLSSGYNIGIEYSKGTEVTLVEKHKPQEKKEAKELPAPSGKHISILGCGGTIASKIEYRTGAVSPSISPSELVESFPALKSLGPIACKNVLSIPSDDMTPAHWCEIAAEVKDQIASGSEGVIITHGTDTMGYTAAALSFMLQNLPVPVVLTGSQRSSDRPSSDNETNLACSALAARSNIAHVGICMHANISDESCHFHLGTKVRKMHTSRRDAFQSINCQPLAKISYSNRAVEPIWKDYQKRDMKRKLSLLNKASDNVALVWVHPGIKPSFIDTLSDYDGIVFAGTGLGHFPANSEAQKGCMPILPNVAKLCEKGVLVAIAPQTIFGRLDMNVYTGGRMMLEAGVIGNYCDWLPETAFVKMCWALGQEKKAEKAKELMLKNIAGEISERSLLLP
jgi:glutamyl-tRNA(Gln) amidotransferase subunit D